SSDTGHLAHARAARRRSGRLRFPKLGENDRVDLAGHQPLLVVLDARPRCERRLQVAIGKAAHRQPSPYLGFELPAEIKKRLRVGHPEVEIMKVDQPGKLLDRLRMIVDAE